MPKPTTSARRIAVSLVTCLIAGLSLIPRAGVMTTRFADLVPGRSVSAQAPANYTYTVIANLSGCVSAGNPVLNNPGEAAFVARCPPPIGPSTTGPVVRRGSGGPLTEIFTWTPTETFSVPDLDLSINDLGTVAFPGYAPTTTPIRYALLVGNGGPINTLLDTNVQTQFKAIAFARINNSGADSPELNNNGVVSFIGHGYGVPSTGRFIGSGGPLTTISLRHSFSWSSINDLDRVAYVSTDTATGLQSILWGDGVIEKIVAGPAAYQSFSGSQVSVSNATLVAFWAQVASGPSGIFIGPNPTTDAVIRTGDLIPGVGMGVSAQIVEAFLVAHAHYLPQDDRWWRHRQRSAAS